MQAQPAQAIDYSIDNTLMDLSKSFNVELLSTYNQDEGSGLDNDVLSLYYSPVDTTIKNINIKGGTLYFLNEHNPSSKTGVLKFIPLGDAKSILGGSSSSGELSEEQKTMIKDLIANWPRLCRLVENFFERNDDNNEYEKKT